MTKVLLIGCGHMGSALLNAWINLRSYSISVVDPINYNKIQQKYSKIKIEIFEKTPNQNQIKKFDIIIFAVKPQITKKVISEYQDFKFK